MALTNSNNLMQSLISSGADALNNLFEVEFTGIGTNYISDVDQDLKVRCQGFTPPATSQDSYQVRFVNAYIDLPTSKVNVTRNFSLTFRVDANYTILKALEDQMGATFNPQNNYTATDISYINENGFTVTVRAINEAINPNNYEEEYSTVDLFEFRGCWISNIPSLQYSTSSAGPASVTVTINFLTMYDLQSGTSSDTSTMTLGTV